jgi:hypothetical protein
MLSDKEKKVITLIKEDESYSNYFFNRVKKLKWFYPLQEQGFFLPDNIPLTASGDYLFWNVLDYLERVSEQLDKNSEYGEHLIDIIDSLVSYSQKKKKINNYHISWYCVKIINNIPNNILINTLSVDQFRIWLKEWTDRSRVSSLTISDIGSKLLPKFLNDDSMIEHAETIIDVITDITTIGRSLRSTKKEDAHLAWDAFWIRDTFKKNYQLIGSRCPAEVIFCIADKLKKVLEYKQKRHSVNFKIGNIVYQIEANRIFADGLKEGKIGFKEDQYHCEIKQYNQEQIKEIDLENEIWALHNIEPQINITTFDFTAPEQDAFQAAIIEKLPDKIDWNGDAQLEKKIGWIFNGLYSDYLEVTFKSLADGGFEHSTEATEVLPMVLRDVLVAKCETNRLDGHHILDIFLSNKYLFPIFRRFVLLCVDKYWSDYAGLLDKFIKLIPNALAESKFEVELQDIFLHHNKDFSRKMKSDIINLINNVPSYYAENGEKYIAHWKYKWFSPLRDNPDFQSLYEDAKKIAEPKDEKPYEPERSSFKGGFISHKSPVTQEEVINMVQKSTIELADYLKAFKGADSWNATFDGAPDRKGLADTLHSTVKDNPEKFIDGLLVLSGAGYYYIHHILAGLKEAWNDSKESKKFYWGVNEWTKIFDFVITYLSQDKDVFIKEALQAQGDDSGEGRYLWVVEDIVDLMAAGCHDDQHAFDPQLFDKAEIIFDLVFPLLKGERHPDTQSDAITYALNTTLGRTIMAYVSYALRVARATKTKKDKWGQQKYERFFSVGIEAYIWFGRYLPQMNYLHEKYTAEKIDYFAQANVDNFEWQNFMEGYLMGAPLYFNLYRSMRNNYLKGLQHNVFSELVDKRLAQHICFGYLQIDELLQTKNKDGQDSLFWKMLMDYGTSGKSNRWLEAVTFFWTLTGRITKKSKNEGDEKDTSKLDKDKILEFWEWTYANQEIVKNKLGTDYNSFLSRMAELTVILDRIDSEKEKWLLLCAPHVDDSHNSMMFIEALVKFDEEESIMRIARIYLKVLEHATPSFDQEHIKLIVSRIYEKGYEKDANEICTTYGRRGVHFLKPLWDKYNKNK